MVRSYSLLAHVIPIAIGSNTLPLVFAIITAVYGLISFSHYGLRSLKLFRAKTAQRWRPVGWTRWGMVSSLYNSSIDRAYS